MSTLYIIGALVAMMMFTSLGVDVARVQVAKTELRRTADAAARYAASNIPNGVTSVQSAAKTEASANTADGSAVTLQNSDIEFGTWDTTARTFTVLTGTNRSNANAIRITAQCSAARGTGVSLSFARILGRSTCDVSAQAIAMYVSAIDVNQTIPATANPFLSGMPAGSVASQVNPHNSPDYAGTSSNAQESPIQIGMPVVAGAAMNMGSITGDAAHDPSMTQYSPDGDPSDIGHNNLTTNGNNSYGSTMYSQNGISDINAPINALVGVFLDDNQPSLTAAPATLDFSSSSARNYSSISPQLKQIFFIGDGLTDSGSTQSIIPPAGATRLFLATWDFYEWNNNTGYRTVTLHRPSQVVLVK